MRQLYFIEFYEVTTHQCTRSDVREYEASRTEYVIIMLSASLVIPPQIEESSCNRGASEQMVEREQRFLVRTPEGLNGERTYALRGQLHGHPSEKAGLSYGLPRR